MFFHNYKYRLLCVIKDRQLLFWTFLFPILLATLFNLAFSNLKSAESFSKINIAIVDNTELRNNSQFMKAMEAVSSSKGANSKSQLFKVRYTSKPDADSLLSDNRIDGYIYFDKGLKMVVKKSGLNQTLLRSFLDDYKQTTSTIMTVINQNPDAVNNSLIENAAFRTDFLKETPISKSAPDTTVHYFFTLIAFGCLYGSFWGLKEVVAIQANLSPEGARVNMAPTHKLKVFTASILAAVTVQIAEVFALLVYMIFALKVDFSGQMGYIILTCIVGSFTGVTLGTFISSVIKGGEGIKVAVLISLSMIMAFLSGMMNGDIKYFIDSTIPVLGYINPGSLITDCFYSLYYYNTHTQYFINISGLCLMTVVFTLVTYFVIRRQKYASL